MKTKTKHILIAVLVIWLAPAITQALYQPISIVTTLIQSQFATVFSSTYDTATPAGTDSPSEADDRMREIKAAVQERSNVDHYWPLTGTEVSDADTGEHRKILFHEPIAVTPTVAASHGDLRIADVAGKAELHWTDEDENEVQLTSVGKILGDSLKDDSVDEDAIELSNNAFLSAEDFGGAGQVSIIKVDGSDDVIIRSVSGNTAKLSSEATLVGSTDIVHKAYVDAQIQSLQASAETDINTANTSFTAMTSMSQAITTTGGNVLVLFSCSIENSGNETLFQVLRDSTPIATGSTGHTSQGKGGDNVSIQFLDTSLAAATYTYSIKWRVTAGTSRTRSNVDDTAQTRSLIVVELGG